MMTPADALRDAVAQHEGVAPADVQVADLDTLVGASYDADWQVTLPTSGGLCGTVRIILAAGGHRYAVHPQVTVFRDVPVAATAVVPGARVAIVTARIACTALDGETAVDPSRAWQARVALPAGAPVTMARVGAWPDLQKGAQVRLEARAGALTVAAPGQLLQDGFTGSQVAVLNLATHKVLTGTYEGASVVAVHAP